MASVLEINGKKLCLITEVLKDVSYSRDYITRLAREKKIVASRVGRQWFIDVPSLQSYVESISMEQEVRKRQLSEERRQELFLRKVSLQKNKLATKKAKTFTTRAALTAFAVFCLGVFGGGITSGTFSEGAKSLVAYVNTKTTNEQLSAQVSSVRFVEQELVVKNDSSLTEHSVPTNSIKPLAQSARNGVLLLPEATTTVGSLFSDEVVVGQLSDGTTVVTMVDSSGEKVGNKIPFVVVPVEVNKTNYE